MSALGPPGPGRTLAAVYALFAIAAGARAGVQIATRFDQAPLAYLLSAAAAAIYVLLALAINRTERRRVALAACAVELGGVLAVGVLDLLTPDALADETVWSGFGRCYGFLPALLPVLGLAWLQARRRSQWKRGAG